MLIFSNGIKITPTEYKCLLHLEPDPSKWLQDTLTEKARTRRDALINQWRPRLFADSNVTTLPADPDALAALIISRPDCYTRLENDARTGKPPYMHNTERFGLRKQPSARSAVTMVPQGLTLDDTMSACILAYVQSFEDWILGALLGQINRGKKKLIREWHPKLLADPEITTIPASEDEFISMVVARPDYQTLPAQLEAGQAQ